MLLLKLSFLFCSERDFIASPSDDKEAEIMLAFNSYLHVLLGIDNPNIKCMVGQIDPPELQ